MEKLNHVSFRASSDNIVMTILIKFRNGLKYFVENYIL